MITKEENLENVKANRKAELDDIFNNKIMQGQYFALGSRNIYVSGGMAALSGLQGFLGYFADNPEIIPFVRDSITKEIIECTVQEMAVMIKNVRDWGMGLYYKNIKKGDAINKCTKVDEVFDINWESDEWENGED